MWMAPGGPAAPCRCRRRCPAGVTEWPPGLRALPAGAPNLTPLSLLPALVLALTSTIALGPTCSAAEAVNSHTYMEPQDLPVKTMFNWRLRLRLEERVQNFSRVITQIMRESTGYNDLLAEYVLMRPRVVPLDGRALLLQVKDTIEADLRTKVEAVESIMLGAEYTYNKYVKEDRRIEGLRRNPFEYLRARKLNTSFFHLTPSPKFKGISVNFTLSTVYVPTHIPDGSQEVLRAVRWSSRLNFDFKKNDQHERTIKWQAFCSTKGVMRIFPGIAWPDKPKDYDCRSQKWYIQAISTPKDIVILMDISTNMAGYARDIAMETVSQILDSLCGNDFFTIMLVSDEVFPPDGCLGFHMIQATVQNKRHLIDGLRRIHSRGTANFEKALVEAFHILNQPREPKFGALSNEAIMLVTTGVTEDYSRIFKEYNSHDQSVRVFTYHIGPQAGGRAYTKKVACDNGGYYVAIAGLADVQKKLQNYAHVMARPLVTAKARRTAWTGPYMDKLGLGAVITISKPVYNKKNDTHYQLLGVIGVDLLVRDLEKHAPPHKLGVNGYAFATDNNGFVLFHPELKTKIDQGSNPFLENIPLTALEQGTPFIEKVQEKMVQQEAGKRELTSTVLYDNKKRVTKRKKSYFYAAVLNTPYSVAVVVPSAYGQNWLDGRRKVADVSLSGFRSSSLALADWGYCRPIASEKSMPPVELILMYLNYGKQEKPDYATRCNLELMESLLFDVQATRQAQNFWMKQAMSGLDMTLPAPPQPKHGVEQVFVATKAGLTRYHTLTDNFTDALLLPKHKTTIKEVYYTRAADSPHFVLSAPYQTSKRVSAMDVIPLITVSKAVVISELGMENVAAVIGMQMRYDSLYDIFLNITNTCPDEFQTCPPTCESAELECYLLDENGYIVLSEISWEVGRFFGEIDGTLMSALIQDGKLDDLGHKYGTYSNVDMYDFQALCEVWSRRDSGANSYLLNPFQYLFSTLLWIVNEIGMFIVEFSLFNWWRGEPVKASGQDDLKDIINVQDVIEEVLSRLSKFGDSDQIHVWKEELFKDKVVTRQDVLEWYESIRQQYGARFEGHEACVKRIPAYLADMDELPQPMAIATCGWCSRPYTVLRVWQTNLIMLVADQRCYCMNEPQMFTSHVRVEFNETVECERIRNGTIRRRPPESFTRLPEEDGSKCGKCSLQNPSATLIILSLLGVLWSSPAAAASGVTRANKLPLQSS